MARPHKVVLSERELDTPQDAHELLATELAFPDYYGANLDALEDCLGDIHRPTRIVIRRDEDAPKAWFDALVDVVCEAAQRSCYLGCSIR